MTATAGAPTAGVRAEDGRATPRKGPFKGLTFFTEDDNDIFFGRSDECQLIASRLLASRFTVVFGESGVGKSSLLRAGVVHDLRRRAKASAPTLKIGSRRGPRFVPLVFSNWRDDPIPALDAAIREAAGTLFPAEILPKKRSGESLDDLLHAWCTSTEATFLIVLDQFEEYLLYHDAGGGDDSFDAGLAHAIARRDLSVRFIVSIREDALAKLDRFKKLIPNLFENRIRVGHLDPKAAEEAIRGPIGIYNANRPPDAEEVHVEDELVEAVLTQVQTRPAGAAGNGAVVGDGQPREDGPPRIETAFLQLVMERIWDVERAAQSPLLRRRTLDALGSANKIVLDYLRDAMNALQPDQQDVAARLFRDLVTPSGQKIAQLPSDLAKIEELDEPSVSEVLKTLADQRVLRGVAPPPGSSESRYEIYHDKLADPILAWRADHIQQEKARAAEQRAKKAKRKAQGYGVVAGVMVGVAVVAVVFAIQARHARQAARAQKLVAQSTSLLAVDPADAVRKAAQAMETKGSDDAEEALRVAVSSSPLRRVFRAPGPIYDASYSDDGRRILAVGAHTATVFDVATHRRLGKPIDNGVNFSNAELSPDGKLVMTAGWDDKVRFWNADTGVERKSLAVTNPSFPGDFLNGAWFDRTGKHFATVSSGGYVRIWTLGAGARAVRVTRPTTRVLTIAAFNPRRNVLAVAGSGGAWILNPTTLQTVPLTANAGSVGTIAWSPTGNVLATGNFGGVAYLWNGSTGQQIGRPFPDTTEITKIAFSPDEKFFATAAGKHVLVWHVRGGSKPGELRGHGDWVNDVAFRDSHVIVTASNDGTARIWNRASRSTLLTLRGNGSSVVSATFDRSGRSVLTGAADGTARLWDVNAGRELWGDQGLVNDAAYSPNGKWIATAGQRSSVKLWNARKGTVRRTHRTGAAVNSVSFDRSGKLLVIGADDGAEVLDGRTLRRRWRAPNRIPISDAELSPGGRYVAIATYNGDASVYDLRTRDAVELLSNPKAEFPTAHEINTTVSSAVWLPHGSLLTTGFDGFAHVWSSRGKRRLLRSFPARSTGALYQADASPTNPWLVVTAGADRYARVWDTRTGDEVGSGMQHPGPIHSAAFSPDGRLVATGGAEGVTYVWDWRHARLLGVLRRHADLINSVSFRPTKGRLRILSASDDGTAKIYGCGTCGRIENLDRLVGRYERNFR
jgi:WD40 repeat protein